jgi:hypothetical protein
MATSAEATAKPNILIVDGHAWGGSRTAETPARGVEKSNEQAQSE